MASPNPNPGGLNELRGVKSVQGSLWAVGSYSRPNGSYGSIKLVAQRSSTGVWRTFSTPAITAEDFLEAVDATGPDRRMGGRLGQHEPVRGYARWR